MRPRRRRRGQSERDGGFSVKVCQNLRSQLQGSVGGLVILCARVGIVVGRWVRASASVCDVQYSIATLKNPCVGLLSGPARLPAVRHVLDTRTHPHNNPIDTLHSSLTYTCATNIGILPSYMYVCIYAYPAPAAVNDVILFIFHTYILYRLT